MGTTPNPNNPNIARDYHLLIDELESQIEGLSEDLKQECRELGRALRLQLESFFERRFRLLLLHQRNGRGFWTEYQTILAH